MAKDPGLNIKQTNQWAHLFWHYGNEIQIGLVTVAAGKGIQVYFVWIVWQASLGHMLPLYTTAAVKVSQFQNEFMKSSFLPKYEQKIVKISALTTHTS